MKTQTITLALLLVILSFTSCKKNEKSTSEASIKKVDTTKQYQNTKTTTSENEGNETYEKKETGEVNERKENSEANEKKENK